MRDGIRGRFATRLRDCVSAPPLRYDDAHYGPADEASMNAIQHINRQFEDALPSAATFAADPVAQPCRIFCMGSTQLRILAAVSQDGRIAFPREPTRFNPTDAFTEARSGRSLTSVALVETCITVLV